jgi:hypothetical protein
MGRDMRRDGNFELVGKKRKRKQKECGERHNTV